MDKFPKTIQLKDKTVIELKKMTGDDLDEVISFFQLIPEEDRQYLRTDITKSENIKRRFGHLNYENMLPIIARIDNKIIGVATLYRAEFGWMRNIGEVRVVIAKAYQRKGIATVLTRELFFLALSRKIYKIQAELMNTQLSAIAAFERLGFRKEATLKKHVTDISGIRRDLIIMTLDIEDLWYLIEDFVKTPDFRIH